MKHSFYQKYLTCFCIYIYKKNCFTSCGRLVLNLKWYFDQKPCLHLFLHICFPFWRWRIIALHNFLSLVASLFVTLLCLFSAINIFTMLFKFPVSLMRIKLCKSYFPRWMSQKFQWSLAKTSLLFTCVHSILIILR